MYSFCTFVQTIKLYCILHLIMPSCSNDSIQQTRSACSFNLRYMLCCVVSMLDTCQRVPFCSLSEAANHISDQRCPSLAQLMTGQWGNACSLINKCTHCTKDITPATLCPDTHTYVDTHTHGSGGRWFRNVST